MSRFHWSALLLLGFAAFSAAAFGAAPYIGVMSQGKPGDASATVKNTCSGCHGMHGISPVPTFPNLAGQNYNYLLKQLENFRSGARQASPMSSMIKTVPKASGDSNLQNLAAYFSSQKPQPAGTGIAFDSKVIEAGQRVFQQGVAKEKVPACAACHMHNGTGMAPMAVPGLAGQHAGYLAAELKRFASGKRDNSPGHVMQLIAARLNQKQIQAVADYLQVLNPAEVPSTYAALTGEAGKGPVPGVPASAVKHGGESKQ